MLRIVQCSKGRNIIDRCCVHRMLLYPFFQKELPLLVLSLFADIKALYRTVISHHSGIDDTSAPT
jgi:hypothetical protein